MIFLLPCIGWIYIYIYNISVIDFNQNFANVSGCGYDERKWFYEGDQRWIKFQARHLGEGKLRLIPAFDVLKRRPSVSRIRVVLVLCLRDL